MSNTEATNHVSTKSFIVRGVGKAEIGGRRYLEDYVRLTSGETITFFSVFDGHSGNEAAKYARKHLWEAIKSSDGFGSKDPTVMKQAIIAGFLKTHEDMWKVRGKTHRTRQRVGSNTQVKYSRFQTVF